MTVDEAIRRFWESEGLGPGRGLVAYSGGADSTALLHALCDLRPVLDITLVAAHLHHGIRAGRADEDLQVCRGVAESLDVPFVSERTDVPELARREHLGVEAAGRRARYDFLERAANDHSCRWIATGHTLDDHAETVLMNIARGCGLGGLRGIARRRGRVIRPLLAISREATREYCELHALPTVLDETNLDRRYTRNRLREALAEALRSTGRQDLYRSIQRLSRIAADDDALLEEMTQEAARRVLRPQHWLVASLSLAPGGYELDRRGLLDQPRALQRRLLRGFALHLDQDVELPTELIESFLERAAAGASDVFSLAASDVLLAVDGETVAVERRSRPEAWRRPVVDGEEILLPRLAGTLSYREGPRPPEPSAFQGLSAAFDRESVRGSLSLFSPPAGAYRPLGFRGSRKVSDQLSSAKLPMWLRRVVPVLADAEGPVWVLGSRIADRVRVRDSTCRTGYVRVRPGGSDGIMSGLSGPDAVTEQDADA